MEEIRALVVYRELLTQFVARSIKTRYKRSVLGVVWTMLNPLLTMLVLTVVFSQLFRIQIANFPVYVLSGQLVWIFFSSTTSAAMGEMLWSGELLKRIYVPKSVFAIAAVGTGLVNLLVSLLPLLAITFMLGVRLTPALLVWPAAILLLAIFSLGLSLLLSTATVYFADMLPFFNVLLTIWLYATPVIYPLEIVPEQWRWMIRFNPLYYLVEIFRQPLLDGTVPGVELWLPALGFALGVLLCGGLVFTAKADEYAYRL
ncbi:MAG: ABC transporter permease [Anaerolineae bacterium]|nr:ABC transporter permease [Anaerolineae bacterium]MBL6965796.1 ABC transporter permease [Anaerolineales bacterium]